MGHFGANIGIQGEGGGAISGVCIKTFPLYTAPCMHNCTLLRGFLPWESRDLLKMLLQLELCSLRQAPTLFCLSKVLTMFWYELVPSSFSLEMNEWMNLIEGSQVQFRAAAAAQGWSSSKEEEEVVLCSAPAPAQVHYTAPWIKFNFIAHCWIQLCCTVLLNWAGCHPLHFLAESTPVLENVFALPRWVSPKNRTCHGHVGTFPVSTIALFFMTHITLCAWHVLSSL